MTCRQENVCLAIEQSVPTKEKHRNNIKWKKFVLINIVKT